VLLSQVVAVIGVAFAAKQSYENRCAAGREPPLERNGTDGVVIRMAGRESNVTDFSMAQLGRRGIFPIFEEAQGHNVKELLRSYSSSSCRSSEWPAVPVYWQVDSGRYSNIDSWNGMSIPRNWLFTTLRGEKLLVLEADATAGQQSCMSLKRTVDAVELDLDLHEVGQGFYRLKRLIDGGAPTDLKLLRVLLVDTSTPIVSGGGRVSTTRQHVSELDLADIVIDARAPLLQEITGWLAHVTPKRCRKYPWRTVQALLGKIPIILETPDREWFLSIKTELAPFGYEVIDRSEAEPRFRTKPADLPVLVYENSSADTIHTIRQLVAAGIVSPSKTCAMITDYAGTKLAESDLPIGVSCICSIYVRLLSWVRKCVLQGESWKKIQDDLDQGLALELSEARQLSDGASLQ
jgi:hypothetical protein